VQPADLGVAAFAGDDAACVLAWILKTDVTVRADTVEAAYFNFAQLNLDPAIA
jgi:hypothetical protein